jgi:hypothetical protein
VLPPEEEQQAERTIAANYGLGRRLYERVGERIGVGMVYVEVVPAPNRADQIAASTGATPDPEVSLRGLPKVNPDEPIPAAESAKKQGDELAE